MLRAMLPSAVLFCFCALAQQPSASPTAASANPSNTIGDPHEELSPETAADKAAAYDKWPEKQRLAVAKAMGHQLSKLSGRKREDAMAAMTPKDKVDAYDYFISHQKVSKKK